MAEVRLITKVSEGRGKLAILVRLTPGISLCSWFHIEILSVYAPSSVELSAHHEGNRHDCIVCVNRVAQHVSSFATLPPGHERIAIFALAILQ